jgi:hypothetical protein
MISSLFYLKMYLLKFGYKNCLFSLLHSATSDSILDKAIDSEDAQHHDFLRLVSM